MPRTKSTKKKQARLPMPDLGILTDPIEIMETIEDKAGGDTDHPYWAWVKELTDEAVVVCTPDEASDVNLFRKTTMGYYVEQAGRYAGFAIGMAYAQRLMTGRGGKLPGGAR